MLWVRSGQLEARPKGYALQRVLVSGIVVPKLWRRVAVPRGRWPRPHTRPSTAPKTKTTVHAHATLQHAESKAMTTSTARHSRSRKSQRSCTRDHRPDAAARTSRDRQPALGCPGPQGGDQAEPRASGPGGTQAPPGPRASWPPGPGPRAPVCRLGQADDGPGGRRRRHALQVSRISSLVLLSRPWDF